MTNTPAIPIPSATVLLLRDGVHGLEVFMVLRNAGIDFAGGALVYPGGKSDPADLQRKPQLIVMVWTALISWKLATEFVAFGKPSRRQGFSLPERKAVARWFLVIAT